MPDTNHLKQNLQDGGAWMRLIFMLLFTVIYSVAEVVVVMVVVFQFLCVLVTGRRNAQALSLGGQLSSFVYQILRYLTYNSEERPYPFAEWPAGEIIGGEAAGRSEAAGAEVKKAAAVRKPAVRKSASRHRKKAEDGSGSESSG